MLKILSVLMVNLHDFGTEIWRQLKAGSRDDAFVRAIKGHESKFESGIAEITPTARILYEEILRYAENLNL